MMGEHDRRTFEPTFIRERTLEEKVDQLIMSVALLEAQVEPWHEGTLRERLKSHDQELADLKAQIRGLNARLPH
jgi:hypothetical protein